MMRALISLGACFVVLAKDGVGMFEGGFKMDDLDEHDLQFIRPCVLDGVEATNELLDSAVFIWAATQRCGKVGQNLKCEIDIASAAEGLNSIINAVLRAVHQCNKLHSASPKCGLAIGKMTRAAAGIAATTGGIVERCPDALRPRAKGEDGHSLGKSAFEDMTLHSITSNEGWTHGHPHGATCLVDLKDTMNSIFKATRRLMTIKKQCDESPSACANNALTVASALAGVGEYVTAAIGHCQHGPITGEFECASKITGLIRRFGDVASAGQAVSDHCKAMTELEQRKEYDLSWHPKGSSSRLYGEGGDSAAPVASGGSLNLILVTLLPLFAVGGFLAGSRWRLQRVEERECGASLVETPSDANEVVTETLLAQ